MHSHSGEICAVFGRKTLSFQVITRCLHHFLAQAHLFLESVGDCGKYSLSLASSGRKALKHGLLYGSYELTIDEKNRLLIPSEIRRQLNPESNSDAFFLIVGINR